MNCAIVKEWMPHYIDGLLSSDMELSIRLHIQSCPDCAEWLEEAKEMSALWSEMEADSEYQHEQMDFPDLASGVMAHIEQLETGRRERAIKAASVRRRSAPRTSWMHYAVAACLSLLLLQFGVFENLAYGITEINGHVSNSVTQWFGGFGK
ncbi:zf-HC2 domain-containing protein [Paenibacillus sp. FSL F4-0125]|uniref:anti-sigma factor family protein n=1 Tax=Paenibacillus sp. FSL F4-0125 TaxID=2954730 RepID=UPI0030F65F9C